MSVPAGEGLAHGGEGGEGTGRGLWLAKAETPPPPWGYTPFFCSSPSLCFIY